ncbi:MAG TPA: hypothetical protein VFE44_02570 [Thermoanaerobaculia bacterium]|nr:hypothetical protein [Thermoanaerobaculia bacterium]
MRQMLRDLGRALSEAISESPEVGRTLRRLRSEGYTLHLVLDCKRRGEAGEAVDGDEASRALAPTPAGEPAFRINGDDLSFLRSCGIDPTRRPRRSG